MLKAPEVDDDRRVCPIVHEYWIYVSIFFCFFWCTKENWRPPVSLWQRVEAEDGEKRQEEDRVHRRLRLSLPFSRFSLLS